jgi:hypothetical protein
LGEEKGCRRAGEEEESRREGVAAREREGPGGGGGGRKRGWGLGFGVGGDGWVYIMSGWAGGVVGVLVGLLGFMFVGRREF